MRAESGDVMGSVQKMKLCVSINEGPE